MQIKYGWMGLKNLVKGECNSSLTDSFSNNATISPLNRIGRQLQIDSRRIGSEWAVPTCFCTFIPPRNFHATREEILSAGKPVRSKNNFRRINYDGYIDRGPIWGLILWAFCDLPITQCSSTYISHKKAKYKKKKGEQADLLLAKYSNKWGFPR